MALAVLRRTGPSGPLSMCYITCSSEQIRYDQYVVVLKMVSMPCLGFGGRCCRSRELSQIPRPPSGTHATTRLETRLVFRPMPHTILRLRVPVLTSLGILHRWRLRSRASGHLEARSNAVHQRRCRCLYRRDRSLRYDRSPNPCLHPSRPVAGADLQATGFALSRRCLRYRGRLRGGA
jgi:hypothetical protein